jgi:hypothetical protein
MAGTASPIRRTSKASHPPRGASSGLSALRHVSTTSFVFEFEFIRLPHEQTLSSSSYYGLLQLLAATAFSLLTK